MADLSATREALTDATAAPELILLAEPRPGIHRQAMVDALIAAAPLARIVVVAGSWCEGELRSGKPLHGVSRLYCHQLAAWWRAAIAPRTAGLQPLWSAPIGAPRALVRNPTCCRLASVRIAIDTNDLAVFETLASVLRMSGATCQWHTHEASHDGLPDLGIWDGGQLDDEEQRRLAGFCRRFATSFATVLVLLDYPRHEHSDMIRQLGASALLGKPYSVDALIDELTQLKDARTSSA